MDLRRADALRQQGIPRADRWREMQHGQTGDRRADMFFGKGIHHVAAAQSGFDMVKGNPLDRRGNRADHRTHRIPLNQDGVRPQITDVRLQFGQQGSPGRPARQLTIGRDAKGGKRWRQQVGMLPGRADMNLRPPSAQAENDRCELYGFGARADYDQKCPHAGFHSRT